ncbi:MAG: molybdopterin-guanine dinucleotide biosynthesis adapter protein [Tepidanaerobacteraceae bacterium]|nr:molybdopterin-guanine dinucleotide biosynthesis adapter protein [Tepidanaerobacteraceae bacterium]
MKVFSVYGITKSGKTTTIENIIKELKRRGYSVGSVKEIHYEQFAIDSEGTNTDRHRRAGAEPVTARGYFETDVMFHKKLSVDEILQFYHQDYVVMEGVTDTEVPKILCAHSVDEIQERIDDTVFAISGVISRSLDEYNGIPVINAVDDIRRLVDVIQEKVFEKLPNLGDECCGLCGKTCREMAVDILKGRANRDDCKAARGSVEVLINGKSMIMVPFVQNMIESVVKAMLSQLKGYEKGDISIVIRQ